MIPLINVLVTLTDSNIVFKAKDVIRTDRTV